MNKKTPPSVEQVKHWYQLINQNIDVTAKHRATEKLLDAFGDIDIAIEFMKKHGIK